jgi:hypothetical protein
MKEKTIIVSPGKAFPGIGLVGGNNLIEFVRQLE